jgi:hypothetical protein
MSIDWRAAVMKRRVAFAKDPKRGSMTRDTVIELRFE